jgi:hypothetical protein
MESYVVASTAKSETFPRHFQQMAIFIFLVVLVCSQSAFAVPLVWVHIADKKLPANVLDGGYDENKVPLYICRVPYKGGIHPGKLISNVMVCNIGWRGKECSFSEYDVLVRTGEPFKGLWDSSTHDFLVELWGLLWGPSIILGITWHRSNGRSIIAQKLSPSTARCILNAAERYGRNWALNDC